MELLAQGIVLLVTGMTTVFVFLILLVWIMNRSAVIIPRFAYILPDPVAKKPSVAAPAADNDLMAAIAVAVAYRQSNIS